MSARGRTRKSRDAHFRAAVGSIADIRRALIRGASIYEYALGPSPSGRGHHAADAFAVIQLWREADIALDHYRPVRASAQPPVRITWMSRSRIFLRSVLRFTPNRSAARIWLPRVAARAADNSGYSTSRRMRW